MGHYCNHCDTYYDLNNKLYTVKEKLYTVCNPMSKSEYDLKSKSYIDNSKSNDNYNIYPKNIQISMGRVGFEPTTPSMSRLLSNVKQY